MSTNPWFAPLTEQGRMSQESEIRSEYLNKALRKLQTLYTDLNGITKTYVKFGQLSTTNSFTRTLETEIDLMNNELKTLKTKICQHRWQLPPGSHEGSFKCIKCNSTRCPFMC